MDLLGYNCTCNGGGLLLLLHFLCLRSLEEIVNLLKATVSVSHSLMLGRPKVRQFLILIGAISHYIIISVRSVWTFELTLSMRMCFSLLSL